MTGTLRSNASFVKYIIADSCPERSATRKRCAAEPGGKRMDPGSAVQRLRAAPRPGNAGEVMNPSQIAQALLASGSDAIVAADRDGIIRHWNQGAERIFGHSAAEAVGKSLDLIIPEQLRARHWDGYRHVMQTGHSRYGEGDLLAVPGLRKDSSRVSLEFTVALIRNEAGETVGVAAILRDVTARFEEMKALRTKLAGRS